MLQSVCLLGLKKKEKLSFQDKYFFVHVYCFYRDINIEELGFAGT